MKIKELIEGLEQIRLNYGDIEIKTEGCDCWGDTSGVGVMERSVFFGGEKYYEVLITRDFVNDIRINDKKEFVFFIESKENNTMRMIK